MAYSVARTAMANEARMQHKYHRWAAEMREHGWECQAPNRDTVRALVDEGIAAAAEGVDGA